MTSNKVIAITGVGLEIPGWQGSSPSELPDEPIVYGEFDPISVLGKKGLRYKDRATILALCSVQKAMQDRGVHELEKEERAAYGVCVSSNLGNMDTVCEQSEIIQKENVDTTSPMALPVASSNVIAASIAMRYGCKAANLMLCNGATSGVDALFIAARMLKAGRAEKMIVVGSEPINDTTKRMLAECSSEPFTEAQLAQGECGACVILEMLDESSDATAYGTLGDYEFKAPGGAMDIDLEKPDVWFIPPQNTERSQKFVADKLSNSFAGVPTVDVTSKMGELYGALGVFQAVTSLSHMKKTGQSRAVLSNGLNFGDGMSSIEISI